MEMSVDIFLEVKPMFPMFLPRESCATEFMIADLQVDYIIIIELNLLI